MLAKVDRLGADPRARRPAQLAAALAPGPDPRAGHQPRPAGRRCCATPAFLAGDVSTDFLDRHRPATPPTARRRPARAAARRRRGRARRARPRPAAPSSAASPSAWRNVVSQPQRTAVRPGRRRASWSQWLRRPRRLRRVDGAHRRRGRLARPGHASRPTACGTTYAVAVAGLPTRARSTSTARTGHVRAAHGRRGSSTRPTPVASGSLLAPMPGTVVRVAVEVGDAGRRPGSRCSCSRR